MIGRGSLFAWDNRIIPPSTLITASSSDPNHPTARLRLRQRAMRWRSAPGWTVEAGVNDALDFVNIGGTFVATVEPFAYGSGTELATAVAFALFTVGAGATWSCDYDTETGVFTISSDVTFALPWSTGANAATSIGRDLGFDTSADDATALAHEGDTASTAGRAWLAFDLGAPTVVDAAFILDFNGNAARVDGSSLPLAAIDTPGEVSVELEGDELTSVMGATFPPGTALQYWRVVLDAAGTMDGFVEVASVFLGAVLGLEERKPLGRSYSAGLIDYSGLQRARQGAAFSQPLQTGRAFNPTYASLTGSELEMLFVARETIRRGVPFYWTPDPELPAETWYVFTETDLIGTAIETDEATWDVSMPLQEMPQ